MVDLKVLPCRNYPDILHNYEEIANNFSSAIIIIIIFHLTNVLAWKYFSA